MKHKLVKAIAGFIILFLLYHAAEYMILFENSAVGFLCFQLAFFTAAWAIARWQTGKGFSTWGLDTKRTFRVQFVTGMVMGIVLYGLVFVICILSGIEKITEMPSSPAAFSPFLLFVFGNFFSSLSEDILTRAYIYRHLHGKSTGTQLIFLTALVYLLNHIYRLDDGPEAWLYLFTLGVLYAIPVIVTSRLWFTGGMHWAGNCVFYLTHGIIQTGDGPVRFSPNYILVLCSLLLIPVNYTVLSALQKNRTKLITGAGNVTR